MRTSVLLGAAGLLIGVAALAEEFQIQAETMSNKGEITEFSGNVRAAGSNVKIVAEMLSFDADASTLDLSGKPAEISLTRGAVTVTISAQNMEYDHQTNEANLRGNASVESGALFIEANAMDYSGGAGKLVASEEVTVRNDNLEAGATSARVNGLDGENYDMLLEGAPARLQIKRREGFFIGRAKSIDYRQGSEQVILRGDAIAEYGDERISGEELIYRLDSGIFTASPSGDSRVTAIISLP